MQDEENNTRGDEHIPQNDSNGVVSDSPLPSRSSPFSPLVLLIIINGLALLIVSVYFRFRALDTIPGFNGDEAWYGIRAWQILHGGGSGWNTPTGNPLNPLFIGPVALLLGWMSPSLLLLRVVALVSGIAALAINWLMCRWVFDRRTAAVSTVMLAVLPIDIAYSRFGWDASQSLAATLPVVYLSLAAVRYAERFWRLIAWAVLAQAVAVWVHPTNIFVGAAIAAACVARFRLKISEEKVRTTGRAAFIVPLVLAGLLAAGWLWIAWGERDTVGERVSRHIGDLKAVAEATYMYPRLFTGGTVYHDVAHSCSWMDGTGIDVAFFWTCALAAAWVLWVNRDNVSPHPLGEGPGVRAASIPTDRLRFRNLTDEQMSDARRLSACDLVLIAAWVISLAAFILVAGAGALAPGQERFAVCLIAPAVLLAARGGVSAWQTVSPGWRFALAAASLTGWVLLADFNANYFRFIERTGGEGHMTFRAAEVEPKSAALRYILDEAERTGTAEVWIVSSPEWIRWPIEYLSSAENGVHVSNHADVRSSGEYRRALAEGRVWFVEFSDTDELRRLEEELADQRSERREILDFARRPVICVLHVEAESAQ